MEKKKVAEDVWVIDGFLSPEECNRHIKISETIGYEFAKVNIRGRQTVMPDVRDNQRVLMMDEKLASEMWAKLEAFIEGYPNMKPIGLNEMWRYYRYEPGERFRMHLDGSYVRNQRESSLLTLIIYLNDNFEGGGTGFRKFEVSPKQGTALIFNHKIRHEGKAIETGKKYVLRTDIMFRIKEE